MDFATILPAEQQAIRAKCFHPAGKFVEFQIDEVEQSIAQRFESIVRKYPDQIAIRFGGRSVTYAELNHIANKIARAILDEHDHENAAVALLLDNGVEVISAILGVLKAGKFYVPLDPSHPRDRLASILEDSQARLVLTDNNNIYLAKDLASDTRHLLQMNDMDVARSTENPGLFIPPDAIASIFYTSGSTGEPKGVIQNHRNVLHRVMIDTNHFHICPEDRLSLLTSPGYSVSLRNLFDALLNGTVLCPFNVEAEGLAHLADWLIQEEITIYFSVPSVFHHAVDGSAKAVHMTTVRLIDLTGEPVTKEDIVLYKKFFPCHCILVNSLGSNEAGIVRRYFIDHDTEIRGNMVPVGYEIESKDVLLLDEFGDEVGINEMGQIAVKSRYLSPGYWRKPDLTQEVFLCSPEGSEERIYLTRDLGRLRPDGCLIHLGREDFQVKIRGQRIEVAEIEMALVDLEAIKEAVVVSRENRSGDRRLVAYLVPSKHPTPSIATLRRELALRLPDYMIPSLYMWVDQLPLTPNKKVDRRALPPPNESRPLLHTPFVAPRTPVEATIAKIWTEVLCLEQVGVHDNFFECGGHSLAAARIVSRVTKTFHLRLPLKALFDSPTVAEMAQVIIETQAELTEQRNLVQALSELESLSDEEAERLLASAREDKRESID